MPRTIISFPNKTNISGNNKRIICGDPVSVVMLPLDVKHARIFASNLLGIRADKYNHLNGGLIKMAWSQAIRRAIKNGYITLQQLTDAMDSYLNENFSDEDIVKMMGF